MNPYIQSLRLRTLPLSVSGIILGTGLAGWCNWTVFGLAVATTLCLQILSNVCNELGDAIKGTDADQHGREAYGLQAGTITLQQMKHMILLFIALSILFGTALVFTAFGLPITNDQYPNLLGTWCLGDYRCHQIYARQTQLRLYGTR